MIQTNIWFWVGLRRLRAGDARRSTSACSTGRPHEVRPKEAAIWTAVWVALALAVRRRALPVLRPRSRPDVPHRLRHRGIAQRRQHLRHRADLRVLPRAEDLPASRAVLRHPRRAGHARPVHRPRRGAHRARSTGSSTCSARCSSSPASAWRSSRTTSSTATRIRRAARPPLPADDRRATTASTSSSSRAGRRVATPLLLVLILVEFTDLIFAVDSIPAIFGVTHGSVHRLHVEHLRDSRPALAVFPARRGGRPVLPAEVRPRRDPDVRRREDARRELLPHQHRAVARRSSSACSALSIVGVDDLAEDSGTPGTGDDESRERRRCIAGKSVASAVPAQRFSIASRTSSRISK